MMLHRATLALLFCSWWPVLWADPVDDFVLKEMNERLIPGLAVAVLKDGIVLKQQAYGVANVEFDVPVTTSTLFALASLTKTFTSAAILSLVEEQNFALDDSVVELLPQLPKAWSPVTIRHCLSHTSGLPDSVTTPGGGDEIADTQDEVLRKLAVMPFKSPGESVSYNQTGYMLLKMIIERVSGKKFELFLEDGFFKPFGMSNTRFGDYRDLIPRRVSIYTKLVPSLDRRSALRGPIDPDDLFSGVGLSPD